MVLPNQQTETSKRIAFLNDAFRMTFLGGTITVTAGLHLLGDDFVREALSAVREFKDFTADGDPYGERDFGALTVQGRDCSWKIEYFDPTMLNGSEDPADAQITRRVLTVMLAEEY